MKGTCILILGGARSGKSRFAQELATQMGGQVLFVATAEAGDEEMRRKIQGHKMTRPSAWRTLEVPTGVGKTIRNEIGGIDVAIVDCVTLLVSNLLMSCGDPDELDSNEARERVSTEIRELVECMN
ncbi:MAG: bifunctional adenosylcobinamide kinase/adenosylcobinamide-phosphate guanylyltransferase, partial [Chloroflexi bacterium]|nr:bifunctional adenosylcobinamide kinase/adenosylcobinamide-phosphate guanylyltransferase [Chloroflexota bacterium]